MTRRSIPAISVLRDGIAVGHGARPQVDGIDAVYSRHNENYPAEFMDMEYPLRMERYAINPDSGGPGKYRGGCGIIRDVRLLAPEGTFGLRVENNRFPAWGVAGGKAGGTSSVVLNPGCDGERQIRPYFRRQSLAGRRPGENLHRRRRWLGGSPGAGNSPGREGCPGRLRLLEIGAFRIWGCN